MLPFSCLCRSGWDHCSVGQRVAVRLSRKALNVEVVSKSGQRTTKVVVVEMAKEVGSPGPSGAVLLQAADLPALRESEGADSSRS